MNKRYILKIHVLLVICLFVLSQVALAEGIKERMLSRLPAIAELKTRGIIGEDNQGYLGFVTGTREQESLISAENSDRKEVYNHFAKQQKTTLAVVEDIQAKRKVEKAKPGEFYQNENGQWIKK